ncbi:hypothetical protein E2562_029253 [Oryza meyeriana var. granulata]|uniref:KIB1-4 beta-propeller domain-containing protein n=1 Tax=Oryza meyeriana var. granulata TaxID=110450 RepID=A0A6G1EQW4_9ORYZ|nr:hypothetical protein E2562_029253 [Oryza meyeriana var. granulata]
MEEHPPWAGLDERIVAEIVDRVPCEIDRLRVYAMCRSWRAALVRRRHPPPPPALPYLFLRRGNDPVFHCVASGWRAHADVNVLELLVLRDKRLFGSYEGSWVFIALEQALLHMLVNIDTLETFDLPTGLRNAVGSEKIIIAAATLSCQPTEQRCVVAGIVRLHSDPRGVRSILLCRRDAREASLIFPEEASMEAEDVLYHKGAFHFLTQGEHIAVADPKLLGALNKGGLKYLRFSPSGYKHEHQFVEARYLVESREHLLMVVRLAPIPMFAASAFRVFQMAEGMLYGQAHYAWEELHTLDGRMLFVGRGCSRSYEAAAYPGSKSGIYFLDDRSWHDPEIVFRDVAERLYDCSDNGIWSGTPPGIEHFDPGWPPGPSNYSPPVWILPRDYNFTQPDQISRLLSSG